jgi:dolichol-phosphate mannosyltransferase
VERPSYSIVIPAHNEEDNVESTIRELLTHLPPVPPIEIVIVDNLSSDRTLAVANKLSLEFASVRSCQANDAQGYGAAIRQGINSSRGDYVLFVMADGSESPEDIAAYISTSNLHPRACVFGTRFSSTSKITGYPLIKRVFNRLGNHLVALLVGTRYLDLTNGFKLYPRTFLAEHPPTRNDFSATLELALSAIMTQQEIVVVPNSWRGRTSGRSSFKLLTQLWPYLSLVIVSKRPKGRPNLSRQVLDEVTDHRTDRVSN